MIPHLRSEGLILDESQDYRAGFTRLASATPMDILQWGIGRFGNRLAIVTSFQIDGMALIDMAHRLTTSIRVVTIDTGRLPVETHELTEQVRQHYGIDIEVFTPDPSGLAAFVSSQGRDAFYRSVSLRHQCCHIRKVEPLGRAMASLDAWISGQRRDQAHSRKHIGAVEADPRHPGVVKLNPLATWSEDQVWAYIRTHNVPYNRLYDQGYTSIGCAPCTRPTAPGEDHRAGRWWWETDGLRECGIHLAETSSSELPNGSKRSSNTGAEMYEGGGRNGNG